MGNGRGSLSARQRAREAKAQLDKERAEREAKIEALAVSFYDGQDSADKAAVLLAQATTARAKAIAELGELKLGVDEIATLCGISATEVRAYRKQAKTLAESADDTPAGSNAHSGKVSETAGVNDKTNETD